MCILLNRSLVGLVKEEHIHTVIFQCIIDVCNLQCLGVNLVFSVNVPLAMQ